jgi:putative FmdB family regulatory protein
MNTLPLEVACMPIYEYRCTGCGKTLEKIQKLGDPPLKRCPECSGKLEKLVSRAAFQFKGGGWYADGYTGKDGGKDGGKKGDSAGTEAAKDTKDTKPETKKAAAGGCGPGACGCH